MSNPLDDLIRKAKEKKGIKVEGSTIETGPATSQPIANGPSADEFLARQEPVAAPVKEETPEIESRKEGIMNIFERRKSPEVPKGPASVEGIPAKEGEEEPDKSTIEKEMENVKKIKVASYGNTTIYEIPGQPLMYYYTPVPRPTKGDKTIINTIKEAATRIISIIPYKIRDPEERRSVYQQKIMEILQTSKELRIPTRRFEFYADAVVREMVGYGLIDSLIKDDRLEEIMVIGAKRPVYVFHREYEMMKTNIEFFSESEIEDLVNRIGRQVGRRVDISAPLLDARLPDGSRVNATIPPISVSGATLTIRKFREDPLSIVDLLNLNTVNLETAAFLWLCVEGLRVKPANILIAGGTGSGKTTTLNVLASFIPASERIVSIEDTAELNLPLKHWIRLESRPPGMEGTGEITMDILTKNSLRMRPDRIIVGEIRHDEAFSLFTAMNTGHEGALNGETLIQFSDGNIEAIGDFVERQFNETCPISDGEFKFVELSEELLVPSFNKKTLKIENRPITRVWKKKTKEMMKIIKTRSGKRICLTKDHPIYRIHNGIQEINSEEAKGGDFIAFPKAITISATEKIKHPYLAGLIYGDGHIHSEGIQFVNNEKSVIENFADGIGKTTKNKVSVKNYGNYSRVNVFDKKLVKLFEEEYDIPLGNKTKKFKITKKALSSSESNIGELLCGFFDAEAHVNLHSNSIQFSTSNPDLAKKLPMILQRFGIHSSTNIQEKDGKGNIGPYYRISIYGKDNLEKYQGKIGFRHSAKRQKLAGLLKVSKNSMDLFPKISGLIKRARSDCYLTQTELASFMNAKTRSTIEAYETNQRNPSRGQLEKIAMITSENSIGKELLKLVESDFRFEEIVEVKDREFEGYVYDLTVKDNHNYIANGLFVSNCMGTVHANSPQEALVRVTSPPMNVPKMMLSGLDFVLIEHRLHDRKKGTIRRITEMAEVGGVLEGKSTTQTLFERDAITDQLIRSNFSSAYLRTLEKYTGLSKKQIDAELKDRERFLKSLVDKKIRSIEEVSKACQDHLLKKRGEYA
ncbi:MAG: ATPase, T2SS/T4P/T4SS family [Candidatus Diapherotrites archaeon]